MNVLKCIEPESEIILKCEDIKQEDVQDREKSLLTDVKEELLTEFEIKTEYFSDSNDENFADCAYEQETIATCPAEDILDVEFNQTISKRKLSDVEETEALKALLSDHNYFYTKRNNLDVTKTMSSFHHNTEINDNAVVFPTEGDSQQPPPPQLSSQDNHLCHFANCGKTFNKVCNLVAHLSNHISNGAGSYQCPEPGCGAKFGKPENLKRHSRAHNTTSGFTCQVRDKRFPLKNKNQREKKRRRELAMDMDMLRKLLPMTKKVEKVTTVTELEAARDYCFFLQLEVDKLETEFKKQEERNLMLHRRLWDYKNGRPDNLKRHSWAHNTYSRFILCQVCDKRFNRADFKVHIAKCSHANATSIEESIGGMDTGELKGKRVTGNYIE